MEMETGAGRRLVYDDLKTQDMQLRKQLHSVQDQMRRINDEGNRLRQATDALKRYTTARGEVQRLNSPI